MQLWNTGGFSNININKRKGNTLVNRSLHEIYIVNNSSSAVIVTFDVNYRLLDDELFDDNTGKQFIIIAPSGTAFFYSTGILDKNNLFLELRTGSQDDRKLEI